MKLAERDMDVLEALRGSRGEERWCRVKEVGGTDASHHSATLARLERRGLAASKREGNRMLYRITPEGEAICIEEAHAWARANGYEMDADGKWRRAMPA